MFATVLAQEGACEPMYLRFSRFRLKPDREAEGSALLRRHADAVARADGCERAWLAQGQHPSSEFVIVALFRDEQSLRAFEGRLRSDPALGSDQFALLGLTVRPPELTEYAVLSGT